MQSFAFAVLERVLLRQRGCLKKCPVSSRVSPQRTKMLFPGVSKEKCPGHPREKHFGPLGACWAQEKIYLEMILGGFWCRVLPSLCWKGCFCDKGAALKNVLFLAGSAPRGPKCFSLGCPRHFSLDTPGKSILVLWGLPLARSWKLHAEAYLAVFLRYL